MKNVICLVNYLEINCLVTSLLYLMAILVVLHINVIVKRQLFLSLLFSCILKELAFIIQIYLYKITQFFACFLNPFCFSANCTPSLVDIILKWKFSRSWSFRSGEICNLWFILLSHISSSIRSYCWFKKLWK